MTQFVLLQDVSHTQSKHIHTFRTEQLIFRLVYCHCFHFGVRCILVGESKCTQAHIHPSARARTHKEKEMHDFDRALFLHLVISALRHKHDHKGFLLKLSQIQI